MRPPPLSPALALKSPATILPTTSRPKQWQLLRTSLEGSTSSHLVGDLIERLGVLDHDAPAPGLHGPGLPEPLHRPADGDALGPDHQGELFMGVVGAEAVASFAGHDPLFLHQLKDEARQPGRYLLEAH